MYVIHIAEEFSKFPAGVTSEDGPNSAQRLLEEFILPNLEGHTLVLQMDGTAGYSHPFLKAIFDPKIYADHQCNVHFVTEDRVLAKEIQWITGV